MKSSACTKYINVHCWICSQSDGVSVQTQKVFEENEQLRIKCKNT